MSELKKLILQDKPADILLTIRGVESPYLALVSREVRTTFAHTNNVLNEMERLGVVTFNKVGRVKYVKLTAYGEKVAKDLDRFVKTMQKPSISKKSSGNKRKFSLIVGGEVAGTYIGTTPRPAAIKAARKGYKHITLRENGTDKLHVYKAVIMKSRVPAGRSGKANEEIRIEKIGMKKMK